MNTEEHTPEAAQVDYTGREVYYTGVRQCGYLTPDKKYTLTRKLYPDALFSCYSLIDDDGNLMIINLFKFSPHLNYLTNFQLVER